MDGRAKEHCSLMFCPSDELMKTDMERRTMAGERSFCNHQALHTASKSELILQYCSVVAVVIHQLPR